MMDNIFGKYRIAAPIGRESSHPACRARLITSSEWDYVVKIFSGPLSSQGEEIFCRYMEELSQLKHASILPLIDYGIEKGCPFYVTKYMAKGSLCHRFEQKSLTHLSILEIFTIIEQIGQVLQYAHNHHILHGNLKPENILFSSDGTALLVDFSLPEDLDEIDYMLAHMERLTYYPRFELVSEKSDQYALAYLANELFSQVLPSELSPSSSCYQNKEASPSVLSSPAIELVGQIKTRLMKAMSSDPDQRYENIAAFVEALDEVCDPFVTALFLPATVTVPLVVKDSFHHSLARGDSRPVSWLKQHSRSRRSFMRRLVLSVAALLLVGLLVSGLFWQLLVGQARSAFIPVSPSIERGHATITATVSPPLPSVDSQVNTTTSDTSVTPVSTPTSLPTMAPISTPSQILVSLASFFNNKGIGKVSGEADFDGLGNSYPASELPSSGQINIQGVPYQFPGYRAGANDNMIISGQTITVTPGNYRQAFFLVSSTWGPVTGTVTIKYTDGSTSQQYMSVLDWLGQGAGVLNTTNLYAPNWAGYHPLAIFAVSVSLSQDSAHTVSALEFASVQSESSQKGAIHIFALTLLA
jgi:serine/threonine protein kinase